MFKFLGKNKAFNSTVLHEVKEGETLEQIARKYGITVQALKQNPTSEIYAGQRIAISGMDHTYHVVKPTETLASIARLYNTTVAILKEKNKTQQVFVGQLLIIN